MARGNWGKGQARDLCQADLLVSCQAGCSWRAREGGVPDGFPQPSPCEEWVRDMRQSSGTQHKLPGEKNELARRK